MARAQRGESAAFGEIYDAYAPLIYRKILLPRLGCVQAAEDALSETFRTAIEKLPGYEQRDVSIYRWLSRIAHNKAMDMLRVRTRTGRRIADMRRLLEPLAAAQESTDELFELAADANEVHTRVQAVLAALLGREDCAAELEVKVGTFDVLLHRAFRSFRSRWDSAVTGAEGESHD